VVGTDPSTLLSGLPSCEIRKQLEQLYQLEHPQHRVWYTSSLFQELVSRGVSLEQAGFLPVQPCAPPPEASKLKDPDSKQQREDYYANVGDAIRTLRDETPYLFQQDLSCKCNRSHNCICCMLIKALFTRVRPSAFVTPVCYSCLEHLVLSVYCFPSYCLLTPLMSPKDKKCKLVV